jgi:hypothetical protein
MKRVGVAVDDPPVDDPENDVFWGPRMLSGHHVRWSRAWYDWRATENAGL